MKKSPSLVPAQRAGVQKNVVKTVRFDSPEAARAFYPVAQRRLLDVNRWSDHCDGPSGTFTLRDGAGQRVDRPVRVGDFFQIDIPGPGPTAGDGYDWVQVEALNETADEQGQRTALRVRPAPSPLNASADVAHFLADSATSTFFVEQRDTTVTAGVLGRNEQPNTAAENWVDKARNAAVAAGAWAGFADVQWENLVAGLVRQDGGEGQ
jgi:hypothetical protein